MSTRTKWIVVGVVLVLVLGVAALYWFNTNLTSVSLEESDGQRTWTIQLGENVTLDADEVRPDDRYRCEIDGSSYGVNETPAPGTTGGAGPLMVSTAEDGTVTVSCDESGSA